MWVLTTKGFVSIIQRPEDKAEGLLTVRARVRQDLIDLFGIDDEAMITDSLHTDYRYRVKLPKTDVATSLLDEALAIDYPNFKDAVARRQGPDRAEIYGRVWGNLYGLQRVDRVQQSQQRRRPGRRRFLIRDEINQYFVGPGYWTLIRTDAKRFASRRLAEIQRDDIAGQYQPHEKRTFIVEAVRS